MDKYTAIEGPRVFLLTSFYDMAIIRCGLMSPPRPSSCEVKVLDMVEAIAYMRERDLQEFIDGFLR
jgi:hypothetical protein